LRVLSTTAAFLLLAAGSVIANDNPFFRVKETTSNGVLRVIGTNVSRSPIVAYVVVFQRANQRAVWRGVYNEGDTLAIGKSVRVGAVPAGPYLGRPIVNVDYIRLANGTSWGNATTDEAKDIIARFKK
jgi:hypothetical protein